jgi:hypothetical protein
MTRNTAATATTSPSAARRAARAKAPSRKALSPWAKYADDGAKKARAAERITQHDLSIRINTRD